jgi:hypothetical protein
MTPEQFKEALPLQIRSAVNPEVMQAINEKLDCPETMAIFKDNLLSYSSVMLEGKFKMTSYINAVKYVSFKLLGHTNISAYSKTFPGKVIWFQNKGTSDKDISSYVHAYHRSKLVNLIMEQTLIPCHVLNAPMYQQAINTQAELMMNAKSEKVRCDASDSLMKQLRPPGVKKVELDIGHKQDKTLDTLRATTRELVEQQKRLIARGASVKAIAEGELVVKD